MPLIRVFVGVLVPITLAAIAADAQDIAPADFNAPPAKLTARTRYFTVVASFETERGAMRRLNELRERTTPWTPWFFLRPQGRHGQLSSPLSLILSLRHNWHGALLTRGQPSTPT